MKLSQLKEIITEYGEDSEVTVEIPLAYGGFIACPVTGISGISVMGEGGWLNLSIDMVNPIVVNPKPVSEGEYT